MKTQGKERFSKRMGLQALTAKITTRYDAPEEFRQYLFFVMQNYGLGLKEIREVVCLASKQAPDSSQWGENDFMKSEIEEKMRSSFWPYIYDLIEMFYDKLNAPEKKDFSDSINEYFLIHGIGWKLCGSHEKTCGLCVDFCQSEQEKLSIYDATQQSPELFHFCIKGFSRCICRPIDKVVKDFILSVIHSCRYIIEGFIPKFSYFAIP